MSDLVGTTENRFSHVAAHNYELGCEKTLSSSIPIRPNPNWPVWSQKKAWTLKVQI